MKNLWYENITFELLYELKQKYNELNNINDSRVKRFYDEFECSFIYNSNAIEGNPITEADTYTILSSDSFISDYTQKANQEVLSLYKAYKYILTKPNISINTMIKLHQYVLYFDPDNAGIYRDINVHIGNKNMLPVEYIAESINTLFSNTDLQFDKDIFETITRFHLEFENIHPFVDGNGRAGRLLLNLMLLQSGYAPINLKVSDKGKYYRSFRQYDINKQKGIQELYSLITKCEYDELTKFISMFVEA